MESKKGQLTDLAVGIIILAIVVSIGAYILSNYGSSVLTTFDISQSQVVLSENGSAQTLTNTPSTWNNATSWNRTWLEFDGVDDNLSIDTNLNWKLNYNMTLSIWVNVTNYGCSDNQEYIIGGSGQGGILYNCSNKQAYAKWRNNSGSIYDIYFGEINDSLWNNLILIHNGSDYNLSIYLNGNIINSDVLGLSSTSYQFPDIYINNFVNAQFFNSSTDEARVYNRTLLSTEITEIYNSGRIANSSLPTDGLILWLPINENSGTDIHSFNQTLLSTTFSFAISGATFDNDAIPILLTENTDYTRSGTTFTITNIDYAWSELNVSYDYSVNNVNETDYALAKNAEDGLGEYGDWFKIIVIIGIAGFVLSLIMNSLGRKENSGSGTY